MNKRIEMTERQIAIHEGLKRIGDEIATFYEASIQIRNSECNIKAKSNLLGHLLRELDSGLRDILEHRGVKEQYQDNLTNEDLKKVYDRIKDEFINYEYLKNITFKKFKKNKGHVSSIISSLNLSIDNPIVIEYIKITFWMHKYAHRDSENNIPRSPKDMILLWDEFEVILNRLVGSFYKINDRLDHIASTSKPSKEIFTTLSNLFKTHVYKEYFFRNLKFIEWLPMLQEQGYFLGKNQPKLIEIEDKPGSYSVPAWPELNYLEWVAEQCIENHDEATIKTLVKILDGIINYRDDNDERIDNYRTDSRIISLISKMPKQHINANHFQFIDTCLRGKWGDILNFSFGDFFDELILKQDKDLILKGINTLLAYKTTEDGLIGMQSILANNGLQAIIDRNSQTLIEVLGMDLINYNLIKIQEIININKDAFNNTAIPTIEFHRQTRYPEQYRNQLIYLTRDALERLNIDEAKQIIAGLLNKDVSIFIRLAIHVIRVRYADLNELFWDIKINPLEEASLKHEVYELLNEHSKDFTNKEINKCISWIESKNYSLYKDQEDKDIINRQIAYVKREWLSALLKSNNPKVISLNEKLKLINNTEISHPGFNSWFEFRSGNLSPLTVKEIQEKSIQEIIEIYNELDSIEKSFDSPTKEGLLDVFIEAVRLKPERYIDESKAFYNAPFSIVNALIRGLSKAWKDDKKTFTTTPVFKVIKQIINRKKFWSDENQKIYYHKSYLQNLLYFIESGVSIDNHSFEKEVLPTLKLILFNIEKNYNYETIDNYNLMMSSINNPKGIIYIVLLQLSLKLGRLQKTDNVIWDEEIKELITNKVNSKKEHPLFYCVIGSYYSHIFSLDKKWAEDNFNKVFSLENNIIWESAITGYFYYYEKFFIEPNSEFMKYGHYLKALKHESLPDEVKENISKMISINFLNEHIEIDNILIQELIHSSDEHMIRSLVFFYNRKDVILKNKMLPRFRLLWERLFEKACLKDNERLDTLILSGTFRWLSYFTEIDEGLFKILLNSSPFIDLFDKIDAITLLLNFVDNQPKKVGDILLKMFEKEVSYDISRGQIIKITEKLYINDCKEIADKICNLHGESGVDILRETYKKYNPDV